MMFVELAWWVFLTPLIVLPFVAILEYKKVNAGALLSIFSVLVSLIIATGILFEVLGGIEYEEHYLALKVGDIEFKYGIFVDPVSAFMGFVVSFISLWVLIYSIEYMSHEKEKSKLALPRYWVEITLFVGSMLGLVYSYSLWQFYIFWELVSLCSYLLIGYWWEDPGNAGKATKALVMTRFADAFFMAGMVLAIFPPPLGAGTWDIPVILEKAMTGALPGSTCSILAMLLFIGCMGKSAQLPFSTWLPDAMVGPTTVSALIHAATYVKAGVYAVARFYPLFVHGSPIEIWGISFIVICLNLFQRDFVFIHPYFSKSNISRISYLNVIRRIFGYDWFYSERPAIMSHYEFDHAYIISYLNSLFLPFFYHIIRFHPIRMIYYLGCLNAC